MFVVTAALIDAERSPSGISLLPTDFGGSCPTWALQGEIGLVILILQRRVDLSHPPHVLSFSIIADISARSLNSTYL